MDFNDSEEAPRNLLGGSEVTRGDARRLRGGPRRLRGGLRRPEELEFARCARCYVFQGASAWLPESCCHYWFWLCLEISIKKTLCFPLNFDTAFSPWNSSLRAHFENTISTMPQVASGSIKSRVRMQRQRIVINTTFLIEISKHSQNH